MRNNLKIKRQEKGFTQEQIAQKVNIATRSYQYIEAGERVPNTYTALQIAEVLNTSVEVLFPLSQRNIDDTNQLEHNTEQKSNQERE